MLLLGKLSPRLFILVTATSLKRSKALVKPSSTLKRLLGFNSIKFSFVATFSTTVRLECKFHRNRFGSLQMEAKAEFDS